MNVGNSLSNRYYPQYHNRTNAKKGAGTAIFERSYFSKETVTNQKNTGTAEDCKALFDFFATYTEKKEVKEEHIIDFSRFAPNAPEEVKKAFREAAEETGYYEYSGREKMNHISQIHVRQVENRQNGVENHMDVFGGSVATALQVARQMLYDMENPLIPDNQHSEEVIKYREQEKEFYRSFTKKMETLAGTDENDTVETVDYTKILEEKINEIFVKIQKRRYRTNISDWRTVLHRKRVGGIS